MSFEVKLPEIAMGITEGEIAQWHKAEGESVTKGELLLEVETAKAMGEVESPVSGVLEKILVDEGDTAEVESVIALITVSEDV